MRDAIIMVCRGDKCLVKLNVSRETKEEIMNKWDKKLEEFIGREKVQSLTVYKNDDGSWSYKYREKVDGKFEYFLINLPDRNTAEKYHLQFGGKNPSTVSCPDEYTKLGEWRADDIYNLGHKITEVTLLGMRTTRNTNIPITLPVESGYEYLIHKKKKTIKNPQLSLRDNERMGFTRVFKTNQEFDTLVDFLQKNELLKKLTFHIDRLVTENIDTNDVGKWRRCRAKDGTSRMILELKLLNDESYQNLMYANILSYADGMADAECKKIPKGKSKIKEERVCYYAAKEGKFD